MNSFATFNQFDKRFNDFSKFGQDRTACPLFGILTCFNFMNTGNISQKQHEENIYSAVTNYMVNNIPKYMSFDELLLYSTEDLSQLFVGATTPELITSGALSYEHIFKFGSNQRYCIVFLKNRNYISILCDNQETYAVRDCHENVQRTFNNFQSLREYLDKTYQFEQMTIVDGVMIPEYSNIEYIVIDSPFSLKNIDSQLFDHSIEEDKTYKIENIPETPIFDTSFDYQLALSLNESQGEDYVNFI
ncbi:hypothetical protein Indivirus_1_189 [Indivirus ILV1]|uniref:Uncharacterized protein n=1 Tax=Indivirus ILV1 TaxID=1977633 RepID=A0A1V0SCX7_9VIRU|nr:hypothetical protein Indivirus_1_189 [Indivirus ILV1]